MLLGGAPMLVDGLGFRVGGVPIIIKGWSILGSSAGSLLMETPRMT